jgi:hypothetical protein
MTGRRNSLTIRRCEASGEQTLLSPSARLLRPQPPPILLKLKIWARWRFKTKGLEPLISRFNHRLWSEQVSPNFLPKFPLGYSRTHSGSDVFEKTAWQVHARMFLSISMKSASIILDCEPQISPYPTIPKWGEAIPRYNRRQVRRTA